MGTTTLSQIGEADRLVGGMRALGDTLQVNFGNMANNFEWVDPVVIALDASPYCDSNPVCSNARDQFHKMQTARNDGTLDKLAASPANCSRPGRYRTVADGDRTDQVDELSHRLHGVIGAGRSWRRPSSGRPSPGHYAAGPDALATGSRQVADGVQLLVDQTKRMGADLGDASAFLLAMKNDAS